MNIMKLYIKKRKFSVRRNHFKAISYVAIIALFSVFVSCYESYIKDYDYTGVCFGTQQPVRTLVARSDNDYLEFRIGVALGGVRENNKEYSVEFMVDPDLLNTVERASKFTLLPEDCYVIDNPNNTFIIPKGKMLGDCPVRILKTKFTDLPNSLDSTYVLPLRLVATTADSILSDKDYTIIVIKYISEYSGNYYCKGSQSEWDGSNAIQGTTTTYSLDDLVKNKIRQLTTHSLTEFDTDGMGTLSIRDSGGTAAANHFRISLNADGEVNLSTIPGCNQITDRGSSYNAETKTFTLNYIYTKGDKSYVVNEDLILRQDVEKDLRFGTW